MRTPTLASALVLLVPRAVEACPVCGVAGTGENGSAYLAMTLLLSGLPLGMIAGVGYWLYRRMASADDAGRTAAADDPGRDALPEPRRLG